MAGQFSQHHRKRLEKPFTDITKKNIIVACERVTTQSHRVAL